MEGGIIQEIFADHEDVQVQIVDYDTEGIDVKELTKTPDNQDAYQRMADIEVFPSIVQGFEEAINIKKEEE